MRDNVTLQCGDCKRRNYVTTKNKKKTTGQARVQASTAASAASTRAHKETR